MYNIFIQRLFYFNKKKIKIFFHNGRCFILQKLRIVFMTQIFLFDTLTKEVFKNHVILLFNQNIILIKPQIRNTQVHEFPSNHGGGG